MKQVTINKTKENEELFNILIQHQLTLKELDFAVKNVVRLHSKIRCLSSQLFYEAQKSEHLDGLFMVNSEESTTERLVLDEIQDPSERLKQRRQGH